MPVSERRGQGFGAHRATFAGGRPAAMAVILLAAGLAGGLPPLGAGAALAQATAEDNPLVQRGVPAEATAETSVIARDQALSAGQRIAYDRMAAALGLARGIPDSQIEGMVQSLVIESERITTRSYTARITVNFNPGRVAGAGGRVPAAAQAASPAPGAAVPGIPSGIGGPAVASVDAVVRYRSFPEWVEINRRLAAAPPIARVQVVTVAGDMARLRLALRSQPPEAAAELAESGIALAPGPIDARPGEGWRLSLAGGR
jgi:hypothetical protein